MQHLLKKICSIAMFAWALSTQKVDAEDKPHKNLIARLDTIYNDDQQYRLRLADVRERYGEQSAEMHALWDTISRYDSINMMKVAAILDEYGWPASDVIGQKGSETIFLVIQHADVQVQDKYLPVVREAVKSKKAEPWNLALLEDRLAMRHGNKQVYGSQVDCDIQGCFVVPVTDPDNLEKRRVEAGLEPMEDYVKKFQMTWNLEEYKRQLPSIEKREALIHPK